MAYLRLVPRNFHDESFLIASSTVSGFDASNTQNSIRQKVWRSVDTADATIEGAFLDNLSRYIDFFGMFLHQCHGGKIQLELFSDTGWTTSVYNSGAVNVINIVPTDGIDWGIDPFGTGRIDPFIEAAPYWLWHTATACKSYRISLSNHSLTYGHNYWQVSRFFLGRSFELFRQPEFGASLGIKDLTDRNRSRGASLRTNIGERWRTMEMNLGAMEESERAGWIDTFKYCGTGRDFVVSLFPQEGTRLERDHILNAKFAALDAIGRQVNRLTGRLQVEEV